jgi:hypothetical protein
MNIRKIQDIPKNLHLADKGVKPIYARPCTVPRALGKHLRIKIARLVDIGVLEELRGS